MKAPRDTIFGMYTHMIVRKDIRFIYWNSMDIRGQVRSIKVSRGQHLTSKFRVNILLYFYSYI